jgi:hypothetical protein
MYVSLNLIFSVCALIYDNAGDSLSLYVIQILKRRMITMTIMDMMIMKRMMMVKVIIPV